MIDDCFFHHFAVSFHVPITKNELSFLVVKMINVVFYDSLAFKDIDGGLAAFVVHNCSFIGSKNRPRALHVMDALYVSVTNCTFQTYNLDCLQGCALSVKGVRPFSYKLNTFSKAFSFNVSVPTLIIEESQFVGSTALLSGGSVSCVDAFINVSNTVFRMTAKSKPPKVGGFIYHDAPYNKINFIVENVSLDVKNYVHPVSLVFFSGWGHAKSLTLLYPQ